MGRRFVIHIDQSYHKGKSGARRGLWWVHQRLAQACHTGSCGRCLCRLPGSAQVVQRPGSSQHLCFVGTALARAVVVREYVAYHYTLDDAHEVHKQLIVFYAWYPDHGVDHHSK